MHLTWHGCQASTFVAWIQQQQKLLSKEFAVVQPRTGGLIGELPVGGRKFQHPLPQQFGEGHYHPPALGYGDQQQQQLVARLRIGGDDSASARPTGQVAFYRGPSASYANGAAVGQASISVNHAPPDQRRAYQQLQLLLQGGQHEQHLNQNLSDRCSSLDVEVRPPWIGAKAFSAAIQQHVPSAGLFEGLRSPAYGAGPWGQHWADESGLPANGQPDHLWQ